MFGKKTTTPAEKEINEMQLFEIQLMQDLFSKMTDACNLKCILPKYTESELSKGEAVCIDRCAAKFVEAHQVVTKKLSSLSNAEAVNKA